MEERQACALLKARFEAAGFDIAENVPFDENGVRFEVDGFDAGARVGYEYVTEEAGDGWDVDDSVKASLEARRKTGELFILVVDEAHAPDAAALTKLADQFLSGLKPKPGAKKPAPAKKLAPAKKPAAAKKSAGKKPARK
jgi:hypothetical protein